MDKMMVPEDKESQVRQLLVGHGVPEAEIERLGGAGGFLSNFLSGLAGGKYPNLTKLIQILITKGISTLGGSGPAAG